MAKKSLLPVPASPRQPLAVPSTLEEQSLALIEKTLGGREALVAALSHAPKSRDLEYLLGLLGDPEQIRTPLGYLCAQGGVTPGELLAAWQSGEILRGHVLATKQVVAALPAVIEDVLKKAAPYEDDCTGCQGLGRVTPEPTKKIPNPEPIDCPVCRGSGRLRYDADLDRAKIALDLAQLTPKGTGISVQVDARQAHLHAGGGSAGGTLEALMAASDQILYGTAEVPGGSPAGLPAGSSAPATTPPPDEVIDADPLPGADSGADASAAE